MALESLERLLPSAPSEKSGTYPFKRIATAALASLAILLLLYTFSWTAHKPDFEEAAAKPLFLSVLIPGAKVPEVELCKTVLTAQILNYAVPVIIPPEDSNTTAGSSSRDTLWQTLAYLKDLPAEAEDGIVILLDGPGTLLQLRPDVLLQRYFRLLAEADRQVKSVDGRGHSVIVSAHSVCGNHNEDTVCSGISVPSPGHTGHGVMIGPARDVRDMLLAALSREDQEPLLAHVFEEQELRRQWFGIWPDYASDLSSPIATNDTWAVSKDIPVEMYDSTLPYWTVSGAEESLPHGSAWGDVQLFTTRATSSTPALLYHSSSEDESMKKQSWSRLWMQPHARALYTAAQLLPMAAVASVTNADGVEQVFWNRESKSDKAGAYLARANGKHEWLRWDAMCSTEALWKEIFQDDMGPWEGSVPFIW